MSKETTFEVDGVKFDFVNSVGGTEEIFHNGLLLSSVKSLMGGKHSFNHEGNDYEVKVKPGLSGISFDVLKNGFKQNTKKKNLSPITYFMCGWPLVLVTFGGAIGGGLGGAATVLNFKTYESNLPWPLKIFLNLCTGIAAIILWFFAGVAILNMAN